MAGTIRGVVVAYDAAHGIILLKHRSFGTRLELATKYAESQEDRGF